MRNSKKFIVEFFIAILVLIIAIFAVDYGTYTAYKHQEMKRCKELNLPYLYNYSLFVKSGIEDPNNKNHRKPYGLQYSKAPIYIFGCTFAYGQYLNERKIFSTLLSDLTKCPVYNRAVTGGSFAHMYYQIINHQIDFAKTKPSYVVYVMMEDHIRRNNIDFFGPLDNMSYLRYKNDNNNLKLATKPGDENLAIYSYKALNCAISHHKTYAPNKQDYNFDLVKLYLTSAKAIINKESPNTKIVLFLYDSNKDFWFYNSPRLNELEKEGIIVVKASQLSPKPLSSLARPDGHPTEKAWETITPNFIKFLNL